MDDVKNKYTSRIMDGVDLLQVYESDIRNGIAHNISYE